MDLILFDDSIRLVHYLFERTMKSVSYEESIKAVRAKLPKCTARNGLFTSIVLRETSQTVHHPPLVFTPVTLLLPPSSSRRRSADCR